MNAEYGPFSLRMPSGFDPVSVRGSWKKLPTTVCAGLIIQVSFAEPRLRFVSVSAGFPVSGPSVTVLLIVFSTRS